MFSKVIPTIYFDWLNFDDEIKVHEKQQVQELQLYITISVAFDIFEW